MPTMTAAWPAASGAAHGRALGTAALVAWLITASIGAYMARAWFRGGGRADDAFPPGVLLGHASLAITGLAVWASYVISGLAALAWAATGVLATAIGLGVSTVTLWTPYPVRSPPGPGRPDRPDGAAGPAGPAGPAFEITDEMLHALLTSPPPAAPRRRPQALVPLVHGIGAITTFLLAVLTAVGTL
jgi:manganese efflux pump family protein